MDLAELIIDKAKEMHHEDISNSEISITISCNNSWAHISTHSKFSLRKDKTILFLNEVYALNKKNFNKILNEILKRYIRSYQEPVNQIYFAVSTKKTQDLFQSKLPQSIRPPINEKDVYLFDFKEKTVIISKTYRRCWSYIKNLIC